MITVEMSPGGVGFIRRAPAVRTSVIPLTAFPTWLTGLPESPATGSSGARRAIRADEHDI